MTARAAAALLLAAMLAVSGLGEEPSPGAPEVPIPGAEAAAPVKEEKASKPSSKRRKPHPRAPHSHDPHHGGQVGMWKDWHLEVAIPAPGDYRVYVTDAYRDPLATDGLGGTLAVTPAGGSSVELRLSRGTDPGCLVAAGERVTGIVDVEVRIEGLPEKVFMEFHFEPGPGVPESTPEAATPAPEAAP